MKWLAEYKRLLPSSSFRNESPDVSVSVTGISPFDVRDGKLNVCLQDCCYSKIPALSVPFFSRWRVSVRLKFKVWEVYGQLLEAWACGLAYVQARRGLFLLSKLFSEKQKSPTQLCLSLWQHRKYAVIWGNTDMDWAQLTTCWHSYTGWAKLIKKLQHSSN